MASKALMANIKESNESFLSRARLEMHDFQFDHDADILYVAIGESTEAFSVPLESMGEQVYLRVEVGTFKIVGLDIMRQGRRENVPAGRSKTVPLNATL